jgi:hypothetical protein
MVKCLMTWTWEGKDAAEVTNRFKKWKPKGEVKFYFPIHTVLGANKAFTVIEVDDDKNLALNLREWSDICVYNISPIMDSRELVSLE